MQKRPLNPFDPGRPIAPGQFVGRQQEIRELEAALQHTKAGKPRHFLITGERGVGKTSFLEYMRDRATDRTNFNFVVLDLALSRKTTRVEFARTLRHELDRALSGRVDLKDAALRVWGFLQRFEVAGVSYKAPADQEGDEPDICIAIADSLAEVVEKVCASDMAVGVAYDGVMLLVDELDQASAELDIGTLFKYLLERLVRKRCNRVVVGLAGLPVSTEILVESHPSSLRIFDELPLANLRREDVDMLLAEAQLQVATDGFPSFEFSDDAKRQLFDLSGGHPHFVHQFGYCAFEKACERSLGALSVTGGDITAGAFASRGALEAIGDAYFRRPMLAAKELAGAISLLDCLAESSASWVAMNELARFARISASDAAEVVKQLIALGLPIEFNSDGDCRIRHSCFSIWFKMQALPVPLGSPVFA